MKKTDIEYGDKDTLSADDFKPDTGQVRLSGMVKLTVFNALWKLSQEQGVELDVLVNQLLQDALFPTKKDQEMLPATHTPQAVTPLP